MAALKNQSQQFKNKLKKCNFKDCLLLKPSYTGFKKLFLIIDTKAFCKLYSMTVFVPLGFNLSFGVTDTL
jgi:hypothetical protein